MRIGLFIPCHIDAFHPEVGIVTLKLRPLASAIEEHTFAHLDDYEEQFEANARANGMRVRWARGGSNIWKLGSCALLWRRHTRR
jgi:hypothetical protein